MQRRLFDLVLIGLVLVFAFLAASFAVRNSDFWLHLASGRLLAEGRYPFRADPFCFTTENHYWANHAWLFDLPLYLLYSRLGEQVGGAVLVVLKALLVSLLALVLLRVRRPDSRLGWPAACTLLAVLAMSPRLLLHSTCLSYFLLALTLWILWRPAPPSFPPTMGGDKGGGWQQLRHYAPLLLLFVLWVNVDGWFLLGPLLAALFWLGDWIAPRKTGETPVPPGKAARTPGWLWPAGLAVCLINPYHVHAFTLPMELMPLPDALWNDVRFAQLHTSPWQMSLYYGSLAGVNLARGAYLVLLTGGALSFLLNIRNLVGWRLLVWLTFAGLSAWLVGTIPFFVVVAAPITALNLQDAFSRQQTRSRLLLGVSYFALALSALALIGLAWPGWLQGFQDRGRHVNWAVQPDSSLRRVAQTLHLWRQQGKLGNGRGFLYHPSVVHYCAYYCPEEKGFLDHRLPLFHDVAGDYEEICRALIPSGLSLGGSTPAAIWSSLLHEWGITHLVLYDPALPRLFPALMQLANEKGAWTLLDIDGQALILGWRDGERSLPSGVPPLDAQRRAFATPSADKHEAILAEAPGQGPKRGPRPDDFLSHFDKPIAPSPWQSEAAVVLLNYFEARAPYETQKRFHWALALLGMPALSSGSLDGLMRLAVHLGHAPSNPLDLGQQSPALPLLAVRAARQALADNPDDANAYLQLGLAYLVLARQTPENVEHGLLRPLAELRHIQIATALENSLRRDPNSLNSLRAHEELAMLYSGRFPPFLNPPFLDAALDHRRAILQLMRRIGPASGEAADAFGRRLKESERNLQDLERLVSDRKNEFMLRTRNLGSEPYRKAELAVRMGLGRLALEDVLMPTSIVLLGGEGIRLQVRLQLMLGQMDLIREQLQSPDWQTNKANLGLMILEMPGVSAAPSFHLPAYEWLLLCQTAADGDYDKAEANVKEQLRVLSQQQQQLVLSRRELRNRIARMLRQEIALRASSQIVARAVVQLAREEMTPQMKEQLHRYDEIEKEQTRTQVMLQIFAGILAVEHGRPQQAKQAFRQALTVSRQGQGPLANELGASLSESYLRLLNMPSGNFR